jgi:hypothetical protein
MESNFLTNFQKAPFLFLNDHPNDYYTKVSKVLDNKKNNICYDENFQKTFFSESNIKIINILIKKTVYNNTCNKYIIRDQKREHLYQIMKGIYQDYAQHLGFKQKEQIEILNKMVIDYCVDIIIKELEFRTNYLRDVFEPRRLIPSPISTSLSGTKLQTPIITSNYKNIYNIEEKENNIYNKKIIDYKNNIDNKNNINKIKILNDNINNNFIFS